MRTLMSILLMPTLAWAGPVIVCDSPVQSFAPDLGGAMEKAKAASGGADDAEPTNDTAARVVVIGRSEFTWADQSLAKRIRARLDRRAAVVVPAVDIYQRGRGDPSKDFRVDDDVISEINANAEDMVTLVQEDMTLDDWAAYAEDLALLDEKVAFIGGDPERTALFNLYYQIGRATDIAGIDSEPFTKDVGGSYVNYFEYQAAALARGHAELLDLSIGDDQRSVLEEQLAIIDSGRMDMFELSLATPNQTWDPAAFERDYEVVFNGAPVDIAALLGKQSAAFKRDGVLELPPGRINVVLRRKAGGVGPAFAMDSVLAATNSASVFREPAKLRDALGGALLQATGECAVAIPDDAVPNLISYARQHPGQEVYVAVVADENGKDVRLFRLNGANGSLTAVGQEADGFPVRFAALLGVGVTVNGASYEPPSTDGGLAAPDVGLGLGHAPIVVQLRAHYQHLMVVAGGEGGIAIGGVFSDKYQTQDGHAVSDSDGNTALHEPLVNRLLFVGAGYMHGDQAGEGLGIRGWMRAGWYNVPHTVETSLHAGISLEGPLEGKGRMKSVIDGEVYGGALIPFGDTIIEKPMPNFGLTLSAGTTF